MNRRKKLPILLSMVRIYEHPNEKDTYIKFEKGDPNASQPRQRYNNVRVQKNGQWLDKNGNPSKDPHQTHIPLDNFNFDIEIFK